MNSSAFWLRCWQIGAALAGLILTSNRGLRQDIKDLRGEVGELRERMAHLEGLLEGLREAITGRVQASYCFALE